MIYRDTQFHLQAPVSVEACQITNRKNNKKIIRRCFVSIKKQYLKSAERCKVFFRVPKAATPGAKTVHIVGEFNNWSTVKTPMKRLKSGEFTTVVELAPGQAYQFRYLIDQTTWENDWEADRYVKSDFGDCENSVVVV
jgi:1,4-alpha-glucan branching enzyme